MPDIMILAQAFLQIFQAVHQIALLYKMPEKGHNFSQSKYFMHFSRS